MVGFVLLRMQLGAVTQGDFEGMLRDFFHAKPDDQFTTVHIPCSIDLFPALFMHYSQCFHAVDALEFWVEPMYSLILPA